MDELKKAIIWQVENTSAKHPVELMKELLIILYTKGWSDGCEYTAGRYEGILEE